MHRLRELTDFTCQREVEALNGKHACDIAVLNEQKATLQEKLAALEAHSQELKASTAVEKADHESKLNQQQMIHEAALNRELKRINTLEDELQATRAGERDMSLQVSEMSKQVQDLEEQLRQEKIVASTSQAAAESQMADLKQQVDQLTEEQTALVDRAKTIETRYRSGDLVHIINAAFFIYCSNLTPAGRLRKSLHKRSSQNYTVGS